MNDLKMSKICELSQLLEQRNAAVAKQLNEGPLTEYEEYLINAPYKKWSLIVGMLQVADITEQLWEDFLENPTHYMIESEEIIFDENWEAKEAHKAMEERNQEIDAKIVELNSMCIDEIRKGNTQNVELYNSVIKSLEEARPIN